MKTSLVGFFLLAASAACGDSTGPGTRQQDAIFAIQLPAHAAVGDTIRISFETGPVRGCGEEKIVSSERVGTGIRFSATSIRIECLNVPVAQVAPLPPILYLVPPPHAAPYTVTFAEPDGADSVRVIPAT